MANILSYYWSQSDEVTEIDRFSGNSVLGLRNFANHELIVTPVKIGVKLILLGALKGKTVPEFLK